MKKLIITPLEITLAKPPFPYAYFCEEAWKKWAMKRLEEAGFDLTREFRQTENIIIGGVIFTQDE